MSIGMDQRPAYLWKFGQEEDKFTEGFHEMNWTQGLIEIQNGYSGFQEKGTIF